MSTTRRKSRPDAAAFDPVLPARAPDGLVDRVWLASQSPRRRQLLEQIGVSYRLLLPDADEDAEALEAVLPRELPQAYVERVTRAKLGAARLRLQQRHPDAVGQPILCADTTVALGRRILGKPADADDARATLALLAGRTHRVITAVTVSAGRRTLAATSVSLVRFKPLTAAEIDAYVESGEPFGKAGSYAVQGAAGAWVRRIDGSHPGIMGLPLYETAQLLRQARVRVP